MSTVSSEKASGEEAEKGSEKGSGSGADESARDTPSKAAEDKQKQPSSRWEEFLQGLERSSLLLCAGVCLLAISIVIWGDPTHIGSHSYPLWMLFFIAGVVAIAGGTLASLAPDDDDEKVPESTEKYVVVERKKWDSTMEELSNLRTLSNKVLPQAETVKVESRPPDISEDVASVPENGTEEPKTALAGAGEGGSRARRRNRRRRKAMDETGEKGESTSEDATAGPSK
jgi:hypothetical protein